MKLYDIKISKVKRFAEACGIELKGENKWITLIQNAGAKINSRVIEERSHLDGQLIIRKCLECYSLKIKEVAYILQQIPSILTSKFNNH
jgi:hypothetical protein